MGIGVLLSWVYFQWTFVTVAFGPQVDDGIFNPAYATIRALSHWSASIRKNTLNHIISSELRHDPTIKNYLQSQVAQRPLADCSPQVNLILDRFQLMMYLDHPDDEARIAALYCCRFWECSDKLEMILTYLDDPSVLVVEEAILQLEYLGDPAALEVLSNPKFDTYPSITKARQRLNNKAELP